MKFLFAYFFPIDLSNDSMHFSFEMFVRYTGVYAKRAAFAGGILAGLGALLEHIGLSSLSYFFFGLAFVFFFIIGACITQWYENMHDA